MDFFKIIVKGKVASDPVFKDSIGKVTTFDLVCHNGRPTEFYHVQAFGGIAEFVNSAVSKGEKLLIMGRLHQQRARTNDGTIVNEVIIIAQTVYILR